MHFHILYILPAAAVWVPGALGFSFDAIGINETSPRGPFSRHLLILHNIRDERRYLYDHRYQGDAVRQVLYRGYKRTFWDVWETASGSAFQEQCSDRDKCVWCVQPQLCLSKIFSLIEGMASVPASVELPIGALFLHADAFINPSLLAREHLDPNKIWQTTQGLIFKKRRKLFCLRKDCYVEYPIENQCLRGQPLLDDGIESGNWFRQHWDVRKAGLAILQDPDLWKLRASKGWHADELCYGWTDIAYIPRSVWNDWRQLTPFFGDINLETGIPTMLNMLVRSQVALGQEKLNCTGGCCQDVPHPEAAVSQYACGHKLPLQVDKVRDSLSRMLATSATEEQ